MSLGFLEIDVSKKENTKKMDLIWRIRICTLKFNPFD